jgi:hypothetical protein
MKIQKQRDYSAFTILNVKKSTRQLLREMAWASETPMYEVVDRIVTHYYSGKFAEDKNVVV